MEPRSRDEAQTRADEIRIYRRELARLEREGVLVLTSEQSERVRAHQDELLLRYARSFDIDRDVGAKQLSLGMKVASFLGAVALAASVFFLFYQFWGLLSTAAQVSTLVAAALGTCVATFWIGRHDSTGYFTKLAALVAFACFVLDLSMLGAIFNIRPSERALLMWGLYALLLAYTFDLRLLLAAAILCGVGYVAARVGTWHGLYWLDTGDRPENFFPAVALLLLIARVLRHDRFVGFAALYRIFAILTALLPMLVLANWGEGSYLEADPALIKGFYQLAGFAGSAVAIYAGARWQWPEVVNTGTCFFAIFLFTKFYDWWWEIMPKYVFFGVVALTAILFLLVLRRLRMQRGD